MKVFIGQIHQLLYPGLLTKIKSIKHVCNNDKLDSLLVILKNLN